MEATLSDYTKNISVLTELTICSNKIIGGGDLIKIQDYVPLIIGAGKTPVIWLRTKIKEEIITLIIENKSLNSNIKVKENLESKSIIIQIAHTKVIYASMIDDKSCIVHEIDLRPIGLDIVGNSTELKIAGNTFSGNTFSGGKYLIGMH